ncbi:unnamed protein product, partial [Rotaria sp. Silwood1]
CNLRSILAVQRRYNQTSITTTVDRRRRQSWQDFNEYHSVPYYQYTCAVRRGFHKNIQCNMNNEHLISKQEILSDVEEEIVDENQMKGCRKETVQETIHHSLISQDRVHISIMTQASFLISRRSRQALVRICTESVSPHTIHRRSRSASRPLVSILRHSSVPAIPRPTRLVESSHIYKSKVDGKIYDLKEFTIPRYYRLYNDVSFREIYNFSRLLDAYLQTNRTITEDYSKMIKNFALKQQLPSPITSVA